MFKSTAVVGVLITVLAFSAMAAFGQVTITQPPDGAEVARRPTVMGTVSDPSAKVWVVVHPTETGSVWVQPPARIDSKGNWQTFIYIGRVGGIDSGKNFEIMAVANPTEPLREGQVLDGFPAAQHQSSIVTVTRK